MKRRDFLRLSGVALLAGLTGEALFSPKKTSAQTSPASRVLVLGLDGLDFRSVTDLIGKGLLPNLSQLNLARLLALTTATVTKPGWAEMETGQGVGQTGITSNNIYNSKIMPELTIYGILRQQKPECWLSCIHSKRNHTGDRLYQQKREPFYYLKPWALAGGMDRYMNPSIVLSAGELTLEQTRDYLFQYISDFNASGKSKGLIFCHFHDPDATGHKYGMGSPQWDASVINLDTVLGQAVQQFQPDAIFVVSDHGFNDFIYINRSQSFGHGNAPEGIITSNYPLISDGIRCDVAPTILRTMGIQVENCKPIIYGKDLRKE